MKTPLLCAGLLALASPAFGQIQVTATAGTPTGNYTTLGAAFTALNNQIHNGTVTINVVGDTNEVGTASLTSPGATSVTIRPSGGAPRLISGSVGGGPVVSTSASVTILIDGLNTGGNALTFRNTAASSIGTCTLQVGQTSNWTVTNCTILTNYSSDPITSAGGAIRLSGSGNNVTISSNVFAPLGGSSPSRYIEMDGVVASYGNLQILNNQFSDWGHFVVSAAIYLGATNNVLSCTISGNRFFQTTTKGLTSGQHSAIWLANPSLQNCTISNNIIGFANNAGTGVSPYTGAFGALFIPIYVGAGTVGIQGNTIAGISVTPLGGSEQVSFTGIRVAGGTASIGTTSGNTIGSQSATDSIVLSIPGATLSLTGIESTSSSAVTVRNNLLGGLTLNGNSGTLTAISGNRTTPAATLTCQDNTIGGTVLNSIQAHPNMDLYGVRDASTGGIVSGNTIRNLTGGRVVGLQASATAARNTIFGLRSTATFGTPATSGLEVIAGTSGATITRNLIHGLTAQLNAASATGITCTSGTMTVANNMIRLGFDGVGDAFTGGCAFNGISEAASGNACTIVLNSVFVGGLKVASSANTFAFLGQNPTSTRRFDSNIFVNARSNASGSAKNYAIQVGGTGTNPTGLTLDKNLYLASGSGGFVGRYNGADHLGIATWKTALGTDPGSLEVDPNFVAPAATVPDLHLAGPTRAENIGNFISGITDDFDGQTRSTLTPNDIGADAANFGTVNSPDASALAVLTPSDGSVRAVGAVTPQARICNQSTSVSVPVRLRILDPNAVEVYNQVVSQSMTAASVAVVNFPASSALNTPGVYTTVLQTELAGDTRPGNDVVNGSFTVVAPLSGTITVGAGGAYDSLTNSLGAFDAINLAGVAASGATLAIISDLTAETGLVVLNAFSGGGQLRIQPSGAPRLISGSSTSALIAINGADNVTIEGSTTAATAGDLVGGNDSLRQLTITNLESLSLCAVVLFADGGATGLNNSIRNVKIVGASPTTTLVGVSVGGSTPSSAGNHTNMRIENCSFRRLRTGIFYQGNPLNMNLNTGAVITKNDLFGPPADRVSRTGIFCWYLNGATISNNTIGNLSSSEALDVIGIGLGVSQLSTSGNQSGFANAVISRNIVGGVTSTASPVRSTAGITITGDAAGPNVVSNNIVYGVIGATPATRVSAGIFVIGAATSVNRLFYNSVYLAGARGNATLGSYALAVIGTNPAVEVRNNIFANLQTSSGAASSKTYAYGTSSALTNQTLDRNLYYVAGAQAAGFRTVSIDTSGTDFATLAAWQTGSSKDPNSLFGDPLFVSATNLHLTAASPANNAGLPVAVTVDIDGETRSSTTPDLGADEMSPTAALSDLVLSNGTLSPAFAQVVFNYTASVANAVSSLTITPTAVDAAATIQVQVNSGGYATVASGTPSASLPLNVGPNAIEVRTTGVGGSPISTINVTVTRFDNLSAGVLNLSTSQGYARIVTQAELADAATFSPGFSPTILSAGPTSAQGGTINFTVGVSATYNTPAPTFTGADSFSYTLQNSLGQMASGTVNVTVTAPAYPARPTALTFSNGTFGGTFVVGVPGLPYRIDYSDDLLVAFAPLMVGGNPVVVTADAGGGFTFNDPTANAKRFYIAVPLP